MDSFFQIFYYMIEEDDLLISQPMGKFISKGSTAFQVYYVYEIFNQRTVL